MEKFTRSQTIGIFVVLALTLGIAAYYAIKNASASSTSGITLHEPSAPPQSSPTTPNNASASSLPASPAPQETSSAEIVVHVAGAVMRPGLYHLKPGARNADALEAAGGPTSDANTDSVNLAAHIQDGTRLYIPTRTEQSADVPDDTVSTPSRKSAGTSPSNTPSTHSTNKSAKSDKLTDPSQGQINLNTASAEQLQRVPGIGPATAERIVAFRQENGGFRAVEDLLQIPGIGDRKFQQMRPFLTVQ